MVPEQTFNKLFEKGWIGSLELKNRIVLAPLGSRMAGVWGEVTDNMISWYARRAKGGASLIIVEAAHAATSIDPGRLVNRFRADDEAYTPGLARLAEAVHNAGSKISIQITAGPGAQGETGSWIPGTSDNNHNGLVGPSTVPSPLKQITPRDLTIGEIEGIVELMGYAAERIKRTGFDTIEIHGHAGYLIDEFLSPYFNKRTDRYGGDIEGRLRFFLDIVRSMRESLGKSFPLTVRYSVDEFYSGGLQMEEGLLVAQRLQEAGIDAIDISCGMYGATKPTTAPMYIPDGYMTPLAEEVKRVVTIPVIIAGGLGDPHLAEQVLLEDKADFIGLGRPLIADPDLPEKIASGRVKQIRKCLRCNTCRELVFFGIGIRCTVNPVAGQERALDEIKQAERAKDVLVIGAGPGGLEAARVAALRGHNVTLCEKTGALGGGMIRIAATPPHKEVLNSISDYYVEAFPNLNNLKVELEMDITASDVVENRKPDVVIIATGGTPIIPDVRGTDKDNVATAYDVLSGTASTGQIVAIVGGGMVGCETADFLAKQGKQVTIIEMLDTIGADIEMSTQPLLLEELKNGGVTMITGATLDSITDEGLEARYRDGSRESIKAKTVILAVGMKAKDDLSEKLKGKVKEVYVIGDARQPRRIRQAMTEGYTIASMI